MAEFINVNGKTATRVELALPSDGAWNATVSMDQRCDLSGKVTLSIGETRWAGTCDLVGDYSAQTSLRIVGAYGLREKIKPNFYSNQPIKSILGSIAFTAKVLVETDITETPSSWTIFASTCSAEIERIAELYGRSWRVTPSGVVQVVKDTYPALKLAADSYQLKFGKPQEKLREYYVTEPTILPGYTFDGFRVDHVRYWSGPSGNYCRVYTI